jgi:hypothetical protein
MFVFVTCAKVNFASSKRNLNLYVVLEINPINYQ